MGPAYLNEYEARAAYYDEWLKQNSNDAEIPNDANEKLSLLIEKRKEAYERLCDIVYERKGYTSGGIPRRETVERFGLLDEQAGRLLETFRE